MKTLVLYFSNTGNNAFLAKRFAASLHADLEVLQPLKPAIPWLVFLSFLKIGAGLKPLQHRVEDYEHVILCGPIWMGTLISPLRGFLKRYRKDIRQLHFASCCGSGAKDKDGSFGYENVFKRVRQLAGAKVQQCQAFSITLVVPADKLDDAQYVQDARLTEETFHGEIQMRFEAFIALLK